MKFLLKLILFVPLLLFGFLISNPVTFESFEKFVLGKVASLMQWRLFPQRLVIPLANSQRAMRSYFKKYSKIAGQVVAMVAGHFSHKMAVNVNA